jgi:hypothetical protein
VGTFGAVGKVAFLAVGAKLETGLSLAVARSFSYHFRAEQ